MGGVISNCDSSVRRIDWLLICAIPRPNIAISRSNTTMPRVNIAIPRSNTTATGSNISCQDRGNIPRSGTHKVFKVGKMTDKSAKITVLESNRRSNGSTIRRLTIGQKMIEQRDRQSRRSTIGGFVDRSRRLTISQGTCQHILAFRQAYS